MCLCCSAPGCYAIRHETQIDRKGEGALFQDRGCANAVEWAFAVAAQADQIKNIQGCVNPKLAQSWDVLAWQHIVLSILLPAT
eukprot:363257-Chlamydomonas_euryale.AAC.7